MQFDGTITSFVQYLQIGLAIPSAVDALGNLISKIKAGDKIDSKRLDELSRENEILKEGLKAIFAINSEIGRWKKVHDVFHDFKDTSRTISKIMDPSVDLRYVNFGDALKEWNKSKHCLRVRTDLRAKVYPLVLDLPLEKIDKDIYPKAPIADDYKVAVDNKNDLIAFVREFKDLSDNFTELLEKGDREDHIRKKWKIIYENSNSILISANMVLISLINIMNHYYSNLYARLS